ncbi:MAG: signal peptidase II [Ardenticatenaceae bacterium]|nr:signal peptidase II [Anaerolineales bacterium]MCB8979247.1 signal peptidase II [Ardenticatenaceae bacterium]
MNEPEIIPTAEVETAVSQPEHPERTPATLSEQLILFVVALLAIGIDQYSKYLVETNLDLFEVYAPIPSLESVFRIFHIYNTGATFGLFSGGGTLFRYVAILVSLGIIYYNFVLPGNQRLLRLALGLQMGGALGNMIDRFRIGHVTDFVDIGPWYIFNLADLSIITGAVILGYLVFQESRELKARQHEADHDEEAPLLEETALEEPLLETAVSPQPDPSHE